MIPSPGGGASGCAASDFNGFPAGAIALIQRGTCTFREKATNAQAAGAVAVVIFNEGNPDPNDDRIGTVFGTLDPPQMTLPVIGTSFAVGQELYNLIQSGATVTVRVAVQAHVVTTESSNVLERVFLDYFASQGLATEPTAFDGRSDYGPFIDRGIPAGGLFTGAEGIKSAAQAAVYGGTAGIAYDPCYHQACDTYPNNVNSTSLDQMADAIEMRPCSSR